MTKAANTPLSHSGALTPALGSFATIPTNPPRDISLRKQRKFLDEVHTDIIFGDCVSLEGSRYALLLVDVATWYFWIYGLTGINSSDIIGALEEFQADAVGLPKRFHTDFDHKLMGDKALNSSGFSQTRVTSSLLQRAVNLLMSLPNVLSKLSSKFYVYISPRSKLVINFVSMPFCIQL